jgi:tetratricopeptide (TPR) repeat protein
VAIRHFETALDLDPNYGRAYAGLAASYWQIVDRWWSPELDLLWLETFELARTNLSKALAQPTALAYQVSADLLRFEGRTEDALRQIEKAIGLEPGKADSFVTKAQVLIDLGRFGEAEQSARLAMRMNPHFGPNYLRALGRAQFFRGQHEEAIKSFTRIVERQPEQKEAFMRIAAAYGQLGRTEEARKAIRHYNNIMAKTKYSSLTVQEAGLWWEDTLVFKDKSIPEPLFDGLRKAGVPEGAAPENEGFDFKSLVKPTYGERGRAYEVADIAKVGAADVKAMLQRGGVVVDVRDAGSYGRGHIPGAHNLDLNLELTEDRLGRLASKSDDVVFHCWGEKCSYSAFACAKARLWGYQNVYYFAGGFPGWKAAGYEIAK